MASALLFVATTLAGCMELQQLDLVFLLDSSSSIGKDNFQLMVNFTHDVVQHFDNIGSMGIQIGLAQFSDEYMKEFALNAHTDRAEMLDDIADTVYQKGVTWTAQALDTLLDNMFSESMV